jgi:hypothetical protein
VGFEDDSAAGIAARHTGDQIRALRKNRLLPAFDSPPFKKAAQKTDNLLLRVAALVGRVHTVDADQVSKSLEN